MNACAWCHVVAPILLVMAVFLFTVAVACLLTVWATVVAEWRKVEDDKFWNILLVLGWFLPVSLWVLGWAFYARSKEVRHGN